MRRRETAIGGGCEGLNSGERGSRLWLSSAAALVALVVEGITTHASWGASRGRTGAKGILVVNGR